MQKLLLLLILFSNLGIAKDLGVQGAVYNIKEQDALEWISERLNKMDKSGEIKRHQEKLKNQAIHSARNPSPVKNIIKTKKERTFEHDLTFIVPYDIKDNKGNIIKKAGEVITPPILSKKSLIFIDGTDVKQLIWALKQPQPTKVVLINGAVIDLMEKYQTRFYFDQKGRLTQYFKIQQVPAIVRQKNEKLIISEVKI